MDWARAIEINRVTLARVVAEIFALLGLVAGGTVDRLPNRLYRAVERLLRPTESALRYCGARAGCETQAQSPDAQGFGDPAQGVSGDGFCPV